MGKEAVSGAYIASDWNSLDLGFERPMMTSRTIGLDLETFTAPNESCSRSGRTGGHKEEPSFLSLWKQRLSSDEELADQLRSGNPDALTVLFKRYNATLFGIARRILRNDAEAEGAVQLIFLDVFRSIQQFF